MKPIRPWLLVGLALLAGSSARGAEIAVATLVDAEVRQVTARLAVRIGPIARIITRKAAQQATGRGEFVRLVADNLDAQSRAAFLRDIGYAET